jgi:hypothetical protein
MTLRGGHGNKRLIVLPMIRWPSVANKPNLLSKPWGSRCYASTGALLFMVVLPPRLRGGRCHAVRVTIAEYDSDTERAYVELRAPDDGEEIIATTIFSFRSKTKLNKPQIK